MLVSPCVLKPSVSVLCGSLTTFCERFVLISTNTSDAGISLVSSIVTAINQQADVYLAALDIKVDRVRWMVFWKILGTMVAIVDCSCYFDHISVIDIFWVLLHQVHPTFILFL